MRSNLGMHIFTRYSPGAYLAIINPTPFFDPGDSGPWFHFRLLLDIYRDYTFAGIFRKFVDFPLIFGYYFRR